MESVRHDLVLLVRLQGTYDRIAEAIRERQTPPAEVKELQEENRHRQTELLEMEARVAAHSEELLQVKKKEDEWKLYPFGNYLRPLGIFPRTYQTQLSQLYRKDRDYITVWGFWNPPAIPWPREAPGG